MRPDKLTVYTLFERTRRYIVPLFQRPYVWSEIDQWQPLWQDIEDKAEQIQDRDADRHSISPHFLGAIVINEKRTYNRQVQTYEIIDGQQRLTTLQVMLLAFRNFLQAVNYKEVDSGTVDDLIKLTLNTGTVADEIERYKVWPTAADQSAFALFANLNSAALSQQKTPAQATLINAYRYFYRMIDEYIQYGETDEQIQSERSDYTSELAQQRVDALFEALRRYLEIVVIELEQGDDPQIIFETLNARGVPLLPSDLIRNFIFLQADRKGEDITKLYDQYWLPYDADEDHFWKTEEAQGRLKRPRIDLFFFHYLTLKTQREIKITTLFQEFRRWWDQTYKTPDRVEDALKDLQNYSQLYRQLMTSDTETRLGVFMSRMKSMETNTIYPLILYLYGENQTLDSIQRKNMIVMLESYLVRRMVCGLSTKNYNKIFPQVLRELFRSDNVDSTLLYNILANFSGDAARWPRDEEFYKRWLNQKIYFSTLPQRARMILQALDMQLETSKQERLYFVDTLSIEHIYPQTPDADVWQPLVDDNHKHTLGNLTLLTSPLNSSVSNGAFSSKRVAIARESRLRLNVYFQDLAEQDTWTEADIGKRSDFLFTLAQQIWPGPNA
jgi:uncharacterized protein with ParB-like and HNH nuclease domain